MKEGLKKAIEIVDKMKFNDTATDQVLNELKREYESNLHEEKLTYQKGIDDAMNIVINEEEAPGEPPKEMKEKYGERLPEVVDIVRATIRATKKSIEEQLKQLRGKK